MDSNIILESPTNIQTDIIPLQQQPTERIVEKNHGQSHESNKTVRRTQPLGDVIKYWETTPPPTILIPGIMVGSIGFVFGVPKGGKTTYTENLGMSIAAERNSFNGYPLICSNKVCLFISFEEVTRYRAERNKQQLQSFTEDEQKKILQNFIISNHEMPRYVTHNEHWKALEDEIEVQKPGVLIIDSLSRLTLDSNGDEETAKLIMKKLREICSKFNCTVIIINHTPKGANERILSIASMSGSRIFMQEADFLIGINRTNDNIRYIKLVCSRYDRDDYETVDTFIINKHQCVEITGQAIETSLISENDGRVDNTNADEIIYAIKKIAEKSEDRIVGIDELKGFFENGGMSRQTFFICVNKLIGKGKIERVKGEKGKYKLL